MHEELKEQLKLIEETYDGKAFRAVIDHVKREKINDNEVLGKIANISQKRFREKVSFTFSVPAGNLLEVIVTAAAVVLALQTGAEGMLYLSAFVLMATLHPLSHYMAGRLFGIRFTHYYLNGRPRFEPTLRIDYLSYLKTPGIKRALMHTSGVIGTVAAPLFVALIALNKGASTAAVNLVVLFLVLVIFELLTSTKAGDLMRAAREYGYK